MCRWSATGAAEKIERVKGEHFINSMAVRDLIRCMAPPPPPHVVEAAERLKYRDFLIVTLVLDHPDPSRTTGFTSTVRR